jgi:hypothetical protein
MDAGLDQEALAHSCLNKTNEKKNNRNDRGSRARRRTNAMPGTGRRCCNIPSCSPRALHRGPLVADVQAKYADLATAPTETKVVELDAGQVRELDRGGRLPAAGFGDGEVGFFIRRPDLSGERGQTTKRKKPILCCVEQLQNRAGTLLGHMDPFQSILQNLNFSVSND